jgi:hypothetical protein
MTPEILETLYIAGKAIGGFILFCAGVFGVVWKIYLVRRGDIDKTDGDISKAKQAGLDAANAVRQDSEKADRSLWEEIKIFRKENEAELERKIDQVHKLREDEKRERHEQELKHADKIGELRGTVNTLKELVIKK